MSRSPERMSSYRRHFEAASPLSSSYQVRVSSPSPTRKDTRHRSASFSRSGGTMGKRNLSSGRKSRMTSSVSMGALCFGMNMGLVPSLDLDAAAAENQEFISTRSGERLEMVALNDRLAIYIEKVRTLEGQNKMLEAEIDALQNRYVKPSGLRQLYEGQLREMHRIAQQLREQRDSSLAAKGAMAGQLEALKFKYEEALEARKKAEMVIDAFRPDVDKATSARISLEKQLENLEVELAFLTRVHKEEIDELMQKIYVAVAKVDMSFALPDLASALKQIQSQYDSIAARNLQEMDAWYKSKFQDLNSVTNKHVQSVRSVREEIASYKKNLLNLERELDSMKTRNESLENQIRDAVARHKKEEEKLLERIEELKLELKVMKEKIALLLREYQELLNVKMALEIEITTYRALIEGEDVRLSTLVQHMSLGGGGMAISASVSASSTSATVPASTNEGGGASDEGNRGTKEAPDGAVEVISSESQTESYNDQSVETTERKTVLVS